MPFLPANTTATQKHKAEIFGVVAMISAVLKSDSTNSHVRDGALEILFWVNENTFPHKCRIKKVEAHFR